MIPITDTLSIPDDELSWAYARSGGPGGQNVNKVASKATLRWAMAGSPSIPEAVKERLRANHPSRVTTEGDFLITSQEYRDQERNRERCVEKLVELVSAALQPPKPRKATKVSKAAKRRRVADKRRQSAKKTTRRGGGWDE